MFKNVLKHLKTICIHKYYVAKYCFKFGLYKQGIFHDLSKFNPKEFWTSVKYYQGNRSPIEAEKEDKGYSLAWLHHFHNNPHHWAYWIDFDMQQNLTPYKIPYEYVIESFCDSIAAGITYSKRAKREYKYNNTFEYYRDHIRISNEVSKRIFHKDTRILFDTLYAHLKEYGIDKVLILHKEKYYEKMYQLLESNYKTVKASILSSYEYTLRKYYTTEDEFRKQYEISVDKMIQRINSFNSPIIKKIILSVDFYTYLTNTEYLEFDKENNIETFYDIPTEIKSELIDEDFKHQDFKLIYG